MRFDAELMAGIDPADSSQRERAAQVLQQSNLDGVPTAIARAIADFKHMERSDSQLAPLAETVMKLFSQPAEKKIQRSIIRRLHRRYPTWYRISCGLLPPGEPAPARSQWIRLCPGRQL